MPAVVPTGGSEQGQPPTGRPDGSEATDGTAGVKDDGQAAAAGGDAAGVGVPPDAAAVGGDRGPPAEQADSREHEQGDGDQHDGSDGAQGAHHRRS